MIIPIIDLKQVRALQLLKVGLIDEPAHLNREWLISHAWIVAPVESAGFTEQIAQQLSNALALIGSPELFAVATERLFEDESCYQVAPITKDLLDFSRKTAPFNFALIPLDRSVAILNTVYHYHLIAGPREFVATAVGGDISGAWAEFRTNAADPIFDGRLKRIVERYEPFSSIIA